MTSHATPEAPDRMINQLVLSADAGFVKQLAVTLVGLRRTQTQRPLTVNIITDDIGPDDRRRIESCAAPHRVRWVQPDSTMFEGIAMPDWLPLQSLYRLAIGDLLPDVGAVLYLDADLVLGGDIGDLLRTRLGDHVVAAVRDSHFRVFGMRDGPPWVGLGVDAGTPYFNAGVLLIDLDRWRTDGFGRRTLDLCRAHLFPFGDQDALNVALAGRQLELASRWNVQTLHLTGTVKNYESFDVLDDISDAVTNPAIIHFTKPGKPWTAGCAHPWTQRWFDELDITPYGGWRPAEPSTVRSRVRKHVSRKAAGARRRASRWVRRTGSTHIATALRSDDSVAWRLRRVATAVAESTGGVVADGPFSGVRVDGLAPSLLPAQVLGLSNSELAETLEEIIAAEPPRIVVIGAEDPVLPAGLATRLPDSRVYVVDHRDGVLATCQAVADLNAVGASVTTAARLKDLPAEEPSQSTWWIIGGAPADVASLRRIAKHARSSPLLITCDDHRLPCYSPSVVETFSSTHQIEVISRAGRNPFGIPALIGFDDADRWLAMSENRSYVSQWLRLTPRLARSQPQD